MYTLRGIALALVSVWSIASQAAPTGFNNVHIDNVPADLPSLVNSAAADPTQFAIDIPFAADPKKSGIWTSERGQAIWRYALTVNGAVSMSFHAINVKLPVDAIVTLSNGSDSFPITSKSLNQHGDVWSRVSKGAVAYISASMNPDEKKNFSFTIVSVQAGYKGFGGAGNAKSYDAYVARAAGASCQVNFSCVQDSSNALPSRSVVGLLIKNTTFCSGNLINDVAGDFKPYVLTARHCGSASDVLWDASTITVAWNAVATCGQPLQNVYNSSTVTSSGATTRMVSGSDSKGNSHGDAWLIELNAAPPVGSHPYWIGFDASDAQPSAVYNIGHSGGLQQQYAAESNPPSKFALAANNVPTTFDQGFWEVVWTTSAVQAGASGSGLIDQSTNRVIGSATGAVNGNNCPGDANPPAASFYRLAVSWSGDGTSSGSIKPWLDPTSTGTLTVDGKIGPPSIEVDAPSTATVGQIFTVSWDSTDATTCTASGGTAGDGWTTGSVSTSGSVSINEASVGTPTYTVSCTNSAGTKSASTPVSIQPVSGGGSSGGSSGGSGGGGAMNLSLLLTLLGLVMIRRRPNEQCHQMG